MINFLKQLEGRKYRDIHGNECLIEKMFIEDEILYFNVKSYVEETKETLTTACDINFLLTEDFKEWL